MLDIEKDMVRIFRDVDVANVVERLVALSEDSGEAVRRSRQSYEEDIGRMLDEGWTESEVVSVLRLTEGVTPCLDEDVACKRMAEITAKVTARLGKT